MAPPLPAKRAREQPQRRCPRWTSRERSGRASSDSCNLWQERARASGPVGLLMVVRAQGKSQRISRYRRGELNYLVWGPHDHRGCSRSAPCGSRAAPYRFRRGSSTTGSMIDLESDGGNRGDRRNADLHIPRRCASRSDLRRQPQPIALAARWPRPRRPGRNHLTDASA